MIIKSGHNSALIWNDEVISYNNLLGKIHSFSRLFNSLNPEKTAIFSENRPEWVYAFFAAWKNNSVVVPIDYLAPAEDIAYILNDCKPEVLFTSKQCAAVLKDVRELLTYDIKIIVFEDIKEKTDEYSHDLEFNQKERIAVIIYTSGTTGSPKGVMLTFDNLSANIEAVSEYVPIFNNSRNVLSLLPLHHVFPLMGTVILPLSVGACIAFSPSMNSEDILSTLQNNKIAIIVGVPRLYSAMEKSILAQINKSFVIKNLFKIVKAINSQNLSRKLFKKVHEKFGGNIKYMVCGGAKLDEKVAANFKALGFEMLEGFGMTETAPMITFTRPGKWKIGSAGQPLPGLEVKTDGGEIIVRGRSVMKGYFNRPRETEQVLRNGWLYTGDLGKIDKDEYVYITGRSKEIIVLSSGKNINPEEIENKIKSQTDLVSEIGIFLSNDSLTAAIYPDFKKLKEKNIHNLEEIFRWEVIDQYNKKAASYKKITKFILCKNELPKTRLGKIQRFKLTAILEAQKIRKSKTSDDPDFEEYTVIRNFLKEQKKNDIAPGDHFEIDLGLDSLDKVNLQVFLESTFGIKIPDDIFVHHPTVEKLSLFMKEKKNKLSVETVKWAEIFKEKVDLKLPKSWFTQNLFKNISKIFFRLYFRITAEGRENLPAGPFIITPNHQSFFDGLFVSVFLKNKIMKNTYFYAKEKHVRNKFVKVLADKNNVIVMDINRDLKLSLQKLAEVLRKGKNIIIFPEGTRTRTGRLGEFKKSFAILSRELNVPVVPVFINGAFRALPRGSYFPKPLKKITIKFLPPIYPEGHSYDSLTNCVQAELQKEVA